jgi:hypothetical protein
VRGASDGQVGGHGQQIRITKFATIKITLLKNWTRKTINLSRKPPHTERTFLRFHPPMSTPDNRLGSGTSARSHDDAGAGLVQAAAVAALGAAARLGDGLEGLDGIHFSVFDWEG